MSKGGPLPPPLGRISNFLIRHFCVWMKKFLSNLLKVQPCDPSRFWHIPMTSELISSGRGKKYAREVQESGGQRGWSSMLICGILSNPQRTCFVGVAVETSRRRYHSLKREKREGKHPRIHAFAVLLDDNTNISSQDFPSWRPDTPWLPLFQVSEAVRISSEGINKGINSWK